MEKPVNNVYYFQKHTDVMNGAKHAKDHIDALIGHVHYLGQLLDNVSLCSDALAKSSDEFVAQRAAKEWGLPVNNLEYM